MSINNSLPINNSLSKEVHSARDRILAEVKEIVSGFTDKPLDRLQEGDKLVEDLGYDSLDLVECTMEVEEHFDIIVPEETAERIKTVGDILDGVLPFLDQPEPK